MFGRKDGKSHWNEVSIEIKWVSENMYTFAIVAYIEYVYKFSGTHFKLSLNTNFDDSEGVVTFKLDMMWLFITELFMGILWKISNEWLLPGSQKTKTR